jgi:tetratricopeptide (TPR) repeat protein
MRRLLASSLAALCLAGSLWAPSARGENQGQADLDKAMQLKMTATALSDLSEVIRLTESALDKGLDKGNRAFAQSLLASSLIQRGTETAAAIFHGSSLDSNWSEYRKLALADLERGVALDAKQPQAMLLIGKLNVELPGGDAKRAAQALDEAIKLSGNEPVAHVDALVLRASIRKDLKDKVADLDEAVRLAPKRAAIFRARGAVRDAQGKLDAALEDLNRAVELDPKHVPSYQAKALVLAKMKKYDEALAVLDKAMALAPDTAALLVEKARIDLAQGKAKAALEELDKADAIVPDNPGLLLLRAGVRFDLGQKDEALADVERVLAAAPDASEALRLHALLLLSSQKLDAAAADLEKLRLQDPKDEPILLELALVYQSLKQYDKAIEIYSGVLRRHPDRWKFLRGRGDALLSVGRRGEAIADFDKVLGQQPKDITVLNNLAWLLATAPEDKLRDGKRAVTLATQACQLTDYKQDYILSTLAAAYAEAGDFDNARKWSVKAVELGGTKKEYGESLKKELASYQAGKPWRESLPEPEEKPAPKTAEKKAP